MIIYTILSIIVIILLYAWLNQVIKFAIVEPVIDGKLPIKIHSQKTRWQVFWDAWKGVVMFWAGLGLGGWLGWML